MEDELDYFQGQDERFQEKKKIQSQKRGKFPEKKCTVPLHYMNLVHRQKMYGKSPRREARETTKYTMLVIQILTKDREKYLCIQDQIILIAIERTI